MKYLWKIGGEAGFGIMTTGLSLSKIATRSGYHTFNYAEYPSLIRGGHNTYDVVICDEQVMSTQFHVDLLFCLNKDTFTFHKDRLNEESIVVYDSAEFTPEGNFKRVDIPLRKIKTENKAMMVMMNTVALGASLALMGAELEMFLELLNQEFGRKGQEVVEYNTMFAKLGYDHIQQNYKDLIRPILRKKENVEERFVMTGNEAFAYGTVAADCRFFASYPMTPTSAVLSVLAGWSHETGMITRHSEDEIAAINSALGASHAGVRSAVATSGGGFALMVEALSLAGVSELPLVALWGQRPGPATGMPTWTEQGDLLFAVHAGHGEFPKIVLAPGDIFEMIEMTMKAFDLADIYQTPVIVMGDKLILESNMSYDAQAVKALLKTYEPNRGKTVKAPGETPYLRYKITDDGVSERLIPGYPGVFYQTNSYEHIEDSHTTEEAKPRIEQVDKRNRKTQTYLKNHFMPPTVYGNMGSAKIVLVSWGGNKGAIREAQKLLLDRGIDTAFLHFTHVFPMDAQKVKEYFKENKHYILLENNSHAQFGKLLQMEAGIQIEDRLLKYDGRPIWVEEIVEKVESVTK